MNCATSLPTPSSEALQLSEELAAAIRAEIARAGGWIDFSRYMQLALYSPGLGYYSAGSAKLGASGDFVTAPELGGLFGRAVALQLAPELERLPAPVILELGAGSGLLAAQVLDALELLGERRVEYRILEPSADLRARQHRTLARFGTRVAWLQRWPERPLSGAVLANEVLDALPVSRFVKRAGRVLPLGVTSRGGRFEWSEGPEQAALKAAVAEIERELGEALPADYRSEVCLILPAWLEAAGAALERGVMFLCDYGLVRREYYHPERRDGTLICHYRHRADADPFSLPGLKDLTAWVDFSAAAAAAAGAGLDVAGFTTQAQFLLGTLSNAPHSLALDLESIRELAAFKTMVLPGEMGERFKILWLDKHGGGRSLPGRDFRDRL
jgi:SAM-dependent MidA family methyltransferase